MKVTATLAELHTVANSADAGEMATWNTWHLLDHIMDGSAIFGGKDKRHTANNSAVMLDLGKIEHMLTKPMVASLLTSSFEIDQAEIYTDVVQQAVLDVSVPASWPGAQLYDENGDPDRLRTFGEYGKVFEVIGGFIIMLTDGPPDANGNTQKPRDAYLRAWLDRLETASVDYLSAKEGQNLRSAYAATQG